MVYRTYIKELFGFLEVLRGEVSMNLLSGPAISMLLSDFQKFGEVGDLPFALLFEKVTDFFELVESILRAVHH